jgi:hypothetical protein
MQPENAAYALRKLQTTQPKTWDDFLTVSSAYFVTGDTSSARMYAHRAIALKRNSLTLLNLAVIYETLGDFKSAFLPAQEAHHLDPANRIVQCIYSDALLRLGRFRDAWPIYADSHADNSVIRRVLPEWDGKSDLLNKRILVLPAGGYGDDILHLRWLPFLSGLGATVTLVCPASMQPLLSQLPYIHHFVTGSASEPIAQVRLNDYHLFTSLRALPTFFCPTVEDIPPAPYLPRTAEPGEFIGLCTRAGEEKFPRRHRSLTDKQILRLISVMPRGKLLDHDRIPFKDWMETANLISSLSLVVTVDTGIAHLAGALGVPAFIILPGISASYYGVSGDSTPFYPSHRLFRNHAEGMDNSVALAAHALSRLETT